jgi:hypothetical protein
MSGNNSYSGKVKVPEHPVSDPPESGGSSDKNQRFTANHKHDIQEMESQYQVSGVPS